MQCLGIGFRWIHPHIQQFHGANTGESVSSTAKRHLWGGFFWLPNYSRAWTKPKTNCKENHGESSWTRLTQYLPKWDLTLLKTSLYPGPCTRSDPFAKSVRGLLSPDATSVSNVVTACSKGEHWERVGSGSGGEVLFFGFLVHHCFNGLNPKHAQTVPWFILWILNYSSVQPVLSCVFFACRRMRVCCVCCVFFLC